MVKIVLTAKDLEKLPADTRAALKEYIFRAKEETAKEIDVPKSPIFEEEIDAIPEFQSVEAISLEASIAFLLGLDTKTSIPCISLMLKGDASAEQIATAIGKTSSKGVNGLIGSINRRFKGLFAHPEANQNLVQFRKDKKRFQIEKTFHPALRFGIWVVSHEIDWEFLKALKWRADYNPQKVTVHNSDGFVNEEFRPLMPGAMKLDLNSIRGFLNREKLGKAEEIGYWDTDGGINFGGFQNVLMNSKTSNSFLLLNDEPLEPEAWWFHGDDHQSDDDYLLYFADGQERDIDLGSLEPDYRNYDRNGKIAKAFSLSEKVDTFADASKFGIFFNNMANRDTTVNVAGGAFNWFKGEREALNYIEQVLPFSSAGTGDASPKKTLLIAREVEQIIDQYQRGGQIDGDRISGLVLDLNRALDGICEVEWIGVFEDMASGNLGTDLHVKVREAFFDNLGRAPYEGPIKNKDLNVFKDTLNTFGF